MEENQNMTPEQEEQLEDGLVILVDEEGIERTFEVIERVELNNQEYAILAPWAEEEDDDSAIPLRIVEENGEELLYDIDDDDEWNAIVDFWNAYVDEHADDEE